MKWNDIINRFAIKKASVKGVDMDLINVSKTIIKEAKLINQTYGSISAQ